MISHNIVKFVDDSGIFFLISSRIYGVILRLKHLAEAGYIKDHNIFYAYPTKKLPLNIPVSYSCI